MRAVDADEYACQMESCGLTKSEVIDLGMRSDVLGVQSLHTKSWSRICMAEDVKTNLWSGISKDFGDMKLYGYPERRRNLMLPDELDTDHHTTKGS